MDVSDLFFVLAMVAITAGVVTLVTVLCGVAIAVACGLLTVGGFLWLTGTVLHKGVE